MTPRQRRDMATITRAATVALLALAAAATIGGRDRMSAGNFIKTPRQREAIDLLAGPASHIMIEGGARSGKTAILTYAIATRAMKAPGSKHLITRFRFNHAKTSLWTGERATLRVILGLMFPGITLEWNNTDYFVRFPNGSEVWIGGLDQKDRVEKILGNEYATVLFNECSQIGYEAVKLALTRLAQRTGLRLRALYDQNPPSMRHWTYLLFHKKVVPGTDGMALPNPDDYVSLRMNPRDNEANLAPGYIEQFLETLPPRERRRFLDGDYGTDVMGALWTSGMLDASRVAEPPRHMERIVVGVDPAVTSKETSDDTGIITAGRRGDQFYVWRDDTCKASPYGWARASVGAYHEEQSDLVVGEANNGGDLVEMNLRTVDRTVHYRSVHASRGKHKRAEPVAGLWEQGKAHICGEMPELEDELCTWTPSGDEDSPNRMDAMVWAISELMSPGTDRRIGAFLRRT